jgi:hypothetical protein
MIRAATHSWRTYGISFFISSNASSPRVVPVWAKPINAHCDDLVFRANQHLIAVFRYRRWDSTGRHAQSNQSSYSRVSSQPTNEVLEIMATIFDSTRARLYKSAASDSHLSNRRCYTA